MKTPSTPSRRSVALAALLLLALASQAQAVKYTVRDLGPDMDPNLRTINGDMLKAGSEGVTYWPAVGAPVSISLLPNAHHSALGPDADGNVFVYAIQLLSPSRPPIPRGPTLDPQKAALWNVKSGHITEVEWPYANTPQSMTRDGTVANSVGGLGQFAVPPFIWNIKTGFVYLDHHTPGATPSDQFYGIVGTANGPDSKGQWLVNGYQMNAAGTASTSATYLWQPGVSVKKLLGPYSAKYPDTLVTTFNDKGQVAGYARNDIMQTRPFVWAPQIGFLPLSFKADSRLMPNCLSNAGQVIGTELTTTGASKAFVWTLLGGVKYFTDLLDAKSKQYTVTDTRTCPDAQGRIVGRAYTPDEVTHSIVLEPTP